MGKLFLGQGRQRPGGGLERAARAEPQARARAAPRRAEDPERSHPGTPAGHSRGRGRAQDRRRADGNRPDPGPGDQDRAALPPALVRPRASRLKSSARCAAQELIHGLRDHHLRLVFNALRRISETLQRASAHALSRDCPRGPRASPEEVAGSAPAKEAGETAMATAAAVAKVKEVTYLW